MGYWFDDNDTLETLKNHLCRRTPDSIRQEAEMELKNRGFSDEEIFEWKD